MKKINIVISFLCVWLFTDAQPDITKRNVTVRENFWKGGDSIYTASEVDSGISSSGGVVSSRAHSLLSINSNPL